MSELQFFPDFFSTRYPDTLMNEMRHLCDPLADAVAEKITRATPSKMIDEVILRAEKEGGVFQAYLDHLYTEPKWLDWNLLEQGRKAMAGMAPLRGLSLLTSSLIEGYSLAKGAHVLVQTGRLNNDVSKRLAETGQMSHNMAVPGGLKPGGPGHRTIMEVRLLHAMVRQLMRKKGWDVNVWDEPINQEDMAFTIIEFDYLATRGIERMGGKIKDSDKHAIHHLWRYAAYLNGVDERLLSETYEQEIELYKVIKRRESKPSKESIGLVHNVIEGFQALGNDSAKLSKNLIFQLCRQCLGKELADAYQLPESVRGKFGAIFVHVLFSTYTFSYNHIPGAASWLERQSTVLFRKTLEQQIEPNIEKRAFRNIA